VGITNLVRKFVKSLIGDSDSETTERQERPKKEISDAQETQPHHKRTFGASNHAIERWNERFPDNDGVSVTTACEDGISGRIPNKDEGEYYFYPPLNAILVVEDSTIITTYSKGHEQFEPHNHVVKCTSCDQVYQPMDNSTTCPWCGDEGRTTGNMSLKK
jgi:hypothetical protein